MILNDNDIRIAIFAIILCQPCKRRRHLLISYAGEVSMKNSLYLLVFVLAVALACATSQTSPASSTNQPSGQVKPTTPGSQEQTPAPGMQAGPASTAPASPSDAQSAIQTALRNDPRLSSDNIMVSVSGNEVSLTGEVASDKEKDAAKSLAEKYAGGMRVKDHLKVRGAAPGNKEQLIAYREQVTGNREPVVGSGEKGTSASENPSSSADLQNQIQNALRNEPTLGNDNLNVTVSEDEIDVAGTVATAKEKLTAKRIVQSYAGNRKVKEQIKLRHQETGHRLLAARERLTLSKNDFR
jgi:osmotically-inducible protein OsmY